MTLMNPKQEDLEAKALAACYRLLIQKAQERRSKQTGVAEQLSQNSSLTIDVEQVGTESAETGS